MNATKKISLLLEKNLFSGGLREDGTVSVCRYFTRGVLTATRLFQLIESHVLFGDIMPGLFDPVVIPANLEQSHALRAAFAPDATPPNSMSLHGRVQTAVRESVRVAGYIHAGYTHARMVRTPLEIETGQRSSSPDEGGFVGLKISFYRKGDNDLALLVLLMEINLAGIVTRFQVASGDEHV